MDTKKPVQSTEEVPQVAQNPEVNVEPAGAGDDLPVSPAIETPKVETVTTTPATVILNCEPCKGQGLIGDPAGVHSICANCQGTGRVN